MRATDIYTEKINSNMNSGIVVGLVGPAALLLVQSFVRSIDNAWISINKQGDRNNV